MYHMSYLLISTGTYIFQLQMVSDMRALYMQHNSWSYSQGSSYL